MTQFWQVVELNPGHVAMQRRVNGQRGVESDHVDLTAIADLLLAGRGTEVVVVVEPVVELTGWVAHRRRRVATRTATKNQLTGQVDRCFPGLGACLSSVCDTKVGRLIIAEFADPARLARLGVARFRAFAARRDVRVSTPVAKRLVEAARQALPTAEAGVARQVLAADLELLVSLEAQIAAVDDRLTGLVPATRFHVLTTVPGWGPLRAAGYAAGVGDPDRWPSHRAIGQRTRDDRATFAAVAQPSRVDARARVAVPQADAHVDAAFFNPVVRVGPAPGGGARNGAALLEGAPQPRSTGRSVSRTDLVGAKHDELVCG